MTNPPCVPQLQVRKSELEKRKNDDEQEEGWVACDACGAWVHMICGMFNKGRNDDDMNYHCPKCLITGITHYSLQCYSCCCSSVSHF